MRTWQIDEFYRLVIDLEDADVALNRNARVIADALFQTRQTVKQCALAGIRIANDRDAGVGALGNGDLIGGKADFRALSHQPLQAQP